MEENKEEWFLNVILMGPEHLSLINHTSAFTWVVWLCHPPPINDAFSFYSPITMSPEGTSAS